MVLGRSLKSKFETSPLYRWKYGLSRKYLSNLFLLDYRSRSMFLLCLLKVNYILVAMAKESMPFPAPNSTYINYGPMSLFSKAFSVMS